MFQSPGRLVVVIRVGDRTMPHIAAANSPTPKAIEPTEEYCQPPRELTPLRE